MRLRKTTKGDRLPSDWGFKLMALEFRVRDFFRPRKSILKGVGIKPGYRILDYGCGPGSYIKPAAELVGDIGNVYALDAHPLALKMVQDMISKKHLSNVETIHSECETGLPDNSLDVVLLYDTLHDLAEPKCVLNEIHRILKPEGVLSLSDHHLKEAEITSKINATGKFNLVSQSEKTYSFGKR